MSSKYASKSEDVAEGKSAAALDEGKAGAEDDGAYDGGSEEMAVPRELEWLWEEDAFTDGFALPGMAETQEKPSLFRRVAEWWFENHGTWFDEFADANCHLWGDDELRGVQDGECRLEWTQVHNKFLQRYEALLEEFISQEGSTLQEFVEEAAQLLTGVSVSLFESSEQADFLNSVMSCLEYEHFHRIMVGAGRRKKFGGRKGKKKKKKGKKGKKGSSSPQQSQQQGRK